VSVSTERESDDSAPPLPDWAAGSGTRRGLEACLTHLAAAIEAARTLGVPTQAAEAVRAEAAGRLGFPADVYVLALVGGTGVGKSSLLNQLAGVAVSPASVRRPTTDEPVAWVPASARADLEGLLEWLGVTRVEEHQVAGQGAVAILDLPDMDSVEAAHRERVGALLPRVDAVAWVTDPEKYHDAVLHDEFLRDWIPRLDQQAIVMNKSDRLDADGVKRIRADLERDLARSFLVPGRRRPPVLVTSAKDGDLEELRGWLASEIESKKIVRARLAASLATSAEGLAAEAGIDPLVAARPFLDAGERTSAVAAITSDVLRAVDLPGLERQAVAATRARARARGTGPVGIVTSLVYRLSGREARVADPGGFLVRWRERGPLAPAVDTLRATVTEPIRVAAPAVRPTLAATVEPDRLRVGLEAAVDRAVARHDRTVPSSRVWPLIGALQTVATFALAASVAWVLVWILGGAEVASAEVPVLGPIPIPFLAVILSLAVGYLLARLLGIHAGWVGRRWAGRLRGSVRDAVERAVTDEAFAPLDRLEGARRALWAAARGAVEECRRT
jgi:predicted ATPase